VVKQASANCGFSTKIVETSYGPYVKALGTDEASGVSGWLYFVNSQPATKGASDYQLQSGDEVLWAFGQFDISASRLQYSVSTSSSRSINVKVEKFDGSNWAGVKSKVFFGTSSVNTSESGEATVNDLQDGVYEIYGEGSLIARTNRELLKIGVVPGPSVALSANVAAEMAVAVTLVAVRLVVN
jgi:hypothetical protein